ncbi:MAG: hypothetical protein HYZ24_10850 [Chloroflexi bacterium]|nr:hypothetical protein [Chloroflexota bacterium]
MPYPEYRDWRTFSIIEPLGWWNDEINTARILAMLHNMRAKEPKEIKEFIRDIPGELLKQLEQAQDMDDLAPEEKKQKILEAVKKDFGIK